MPVAINITGDNHQQAVSELVGLAGCFGGAMPVLGGDASESTTTRVPRSRGGKNTKTTGGEPDTAALTAATGQNISTGGERVEPTEQAQVETVVDQKPTEPEKKLLTLDDVRAAAKPYIDKWTMKVAGVDLTPCLKDATGKEKISDLEGADQETLQKAVDAFTAAGKADARYVPKAG